MHGSTQVIDDPLFDPETLKQKDACRGAVLLCEWVRSSYNYADEHAAFASEPSQEVHPHLEHACDTEADLLGLREELEASKKKAARQHVLITKEAVIRMLNTAEPTSHTMQVCSALRLALVPRG